MKNNKIRFDLLFLFVAALLIRLLLGSVEIALLQRPDSESYLAPAYALLSDFSYSSGGKLTALRVPVYSSLLALGLWVSGMSLRFCSIVGCVISAAAAPLISLTAGETGCDRRCAFFAGLFWALSPTSAAFAPMILSDNLFSVICAVELYFLLRYLKRGEVSSLYFTAAAAGIGALTRPLNLLWIIVCLAAVVYREYRGSRRKLILHCGISVLIFSVIVFPWVLRNRIQGFGWRIDSVSADSLRHNASVVESRVLKVPAETLRQRYDEHFRAEFMKYPDRFPDENARLTYQEKYLSQKIKAHPLVYLRGFWNPVLFVPDMPTLFENLGYVVGGRGTWDVVVKDGFAAGVRHYFRGNSCLMSVALAVGFFSAVWYLLSILGIAVLIRRDLGMLLLFFGFCIYYLTVVGPVNYPRFHLPSLPFLCVSAGVGLGILYNIPAIFLKKRLKNPENGVKLQENNLGRKEHVK